MSQEKREQVEQYLKDNCIRYAVHFELSPQPDAKKPSDLRIQWSVTVGQSVFQYWTGIGHLPKDARPPEKATIHEGGLGKIMQNYRMAVCNGLHWKTGKAWHMLPENQPHPADVLCCLLSDSDALQYPTFEEWASTYGYNEDSRSGEKIYRACIESGLKLRRELGDKGMTDLAEILQDY